jgi:hypothetical protein
MQTLLKEKTAKQSALTVYCETDFATIGKTKGVTSRACNIFRLLIQTDC